MSVMCCGEADESNGAEHAVWCQSYDLAKAVAAARREGWTQAIEALRAEAAQALTEADAHEDKSHFITAAEYRDDARRWTFAADYLTDRAAALTEEAGQ